MLSGCYVVYSSFWKFFYIQKYITQGKCYIHLTSAPKNLQHNQEPQQLKIQVAQTSHHLALFSGVVRGGKVGVIHLRGLLISCCITWDSQI